MNSLIEISIVVFKQKYRLRMDILELLLFSSLILLGWIFDEGYCDLKNMKNIMI